MNKFTFLILLVSVIICMLGCAYFSAVYIIRKDYLKLYIALESELFEIIALATLIIINSRKK